MRESELQTKVIQTCNWFGLRTYHTFDSRHSAAGFPDLVIVGPKGVLFVELKSTKGVATPQQLAWLGDLRAAGSEALLVRPGDFEELMIHLKRIAGK